jgi:hypothetical protein
MQAAKANLRCLSLLSFSRNTVVPHESLHVSDSFLYTLKANYVPCLCCNTLAIGWLGPVA